MLRVTLFISSQLQCDRGQQWKDIRRIHISNNRLTEVLSPPRHRKGEAANSNALHEFFTVNRPYLFATMGLELLANLPHIGESYGKETTD